jgi:hypothetical protein
MKKKVRAGSRGVCVDAYVLGALEGDDWLFLDEGGVTSEERSSS